MDAHQKGELTEAAVLAELKHHGIPVLTPFGDNQRYDMVVETPAGELLTLQIKTGRLSNGVITFHTKSQHTNAEGNVYKYYDGEIDCFVVYVHELETLYLIYIDEFDRRISLRVENPDQPDPSINWADDYEFDARWPPSAHRIRSASHGRAPPSSRSANAYRSALSRSFRSTMSHTTSSPATGRVPSTGYVPVPEASSTVGYAFRPGIRTPSTSTASTVRRRRKSTSLRTMSSISPSPCASTRRTSRTPRSTGPWTTVSTNGGRRSPTRFGCLCQNLL